MKNLIPYRFNSNNTYQTAVTRKQDNNLRVRLTHIQPSVFHQYNVFDEHFQNNTLQLLNRNIFFEAHSGDLHSLYDYDSLTIREVRQAIAALQPRSTRYKCQNCTLTNNESLDHYLPQQEFPEYVIHTTNLIPSCKTCNGYKSNVWRREGSRVFLNHYIDELPEIRYLFVEVFNDVDGEINFRYFLENLGEINNDMFSLIESHYTRLRLPERMRISSIGVLSELENTILSFMTKLSLDDTVETVVVNANMNMITYGTNYWKSVLELTLVQNDAFLDRFRA